MSFCPLLAAPRVEKMESGSEKLQGAGDWMGDPRSQGGREQDKLFTTGSQQSQELGVTGARASGQGRRSEQ